MRNHSEKSRDMARSVLPSTARRGARKTRASIHRRERARVSRLAYELSVAPDASEVDTFVPTDRRAVADMKEARRRADKVGPLMRWAERTVELDPGLRDGTVQDRIAHFRRLLPPGLIGNHALSHLRWVVDPGSCYWNLQGPRVLFGTVPTPLDIALVRAIIAGGLHGELNRRLASRCSYSVTSHVWVPPVRVINASHPRPGVLVPGHTVTGSATYRPHPLAGLHNVEDFVRRASPAVLHEVRSLATELC